MFNFFKRSKSQKSKQKQDRKLHQSQQLDDDGVGSALKVAASGACVANTLATHPATPAAAAPPPMQLLERVGDSDRAKVQPPVVQRRNSSGSGRGGESVKNKQHSPPTATSFSPNDIIRENGCSSSFNFENDTGSGAIEFVDQDTDEDDGGAINEHREQHEDLHLQVLGETNDRSQQSVSYNQTANLLESAMAKGKNKRRNQQQHQGGKNITQQQQGQTLHTNKDNHLLLKQTCNDSEKVDPVPAEKVVITEVTQPAENVTKVQEIDIKFNHSEHNSNEEQKVNIVNRDAGSVEQQQCLMAGDVNGNSVEDGEDKNSIVECSDIHKPSSLGDRYHDRCPGDGVSVMTEDQTAPTPPPITQSSTSLFPLTQTTITEVTADVCGGNELLNITNSVLQSPAVELHSSAITIPHEIKDGTREPVGISETVTRGDVTSETEMGQQPSKPSEPRRSITPNRQPTLITEDHPQQQLTVQVKQDASRDDISDDRDVFYEATESLSPTSSPASLDGNRKALPFAPIVAATHEGSPLKTIISTSTVNQSGPRASPKKRVVFSDQLIIEGNPSQESVLLNGSASTESLPDALILESPSYEHRVAKNDDDHDDDEQMHVESSPHTSPVNNNHVNVVLSVGNEQNAFNSDKSGISSSVPAVTIVSNPNLIEFQYDHSEKSASPKLTGDKEEIDQNHSQTVVVGENETVIIENGTTFTVEDTISLPDVVQPTNAEKVIKQPFNTVDKINSEMKELVNQETRYSVKLEDAEKRASEAQTKVYELKLRLDDVERDVSWKECNVERLKAELEAACKECESIRARLRTQDAEICAQRLKSSDMEDELNLKYQNLEVELLEVNEKLKEVRQLAHDLNIQLLNARTEAEMLQKEKDKLLEERGEEQKIIKEALELALKERAQIESKWKHDFEQLRTVHSDREEHLMEDCEWKIRTMQKSCKEKMEAIERERKMAMDKVVRLEQDTRKHMEEANHLRSFEAEVAQLRGLTYDQKEALSATTRQVDQLKAELEEASNKLEAEIVKVQQIKNRCEYQLCEKEREALNRIEIARGEIAMQWEDRLLREMNRLKMELEQTHMEERVSAINRIKREALEETEALKQKFNMRERQLKEEIESLKVTLQQHRQAMEDAQTDTDVKLMQSRMFVERSEREHEAILAKEVSKRDEIIENLKEQNEKERQDMEQHFSLRIQQVQEEFARELSDTTELLKMSHKKELEKQWKQLVSEKEEALQLMETRQRTRLEEAENKIRELTIGHQRQLKDFHEDHRYEVGSLEARDIKNAQEIQTLHKKCRCLTNLFEEMRMRYERRDPRPEDLQQIEELKSVIESQDHDLRLLTERLRELQLQEKEQQQQQQQRAFLQQQQQQQQPPQPPRRAKNRGKQHNQHQNDQLVVEEQQQQPPQVQIQPMVTSVPIVCDVIYEENEADLIKEEQEQQEEPIEQIIVVDVPESAIQTETTTVKSTEPVFIESPPSSPLSAVTPVIDEETQSPVEQVMNLPSEQLEIPVIQIDQLPESHPTKPSAPIPTPIIVITEEPELEGEEADTSEVSISTIVELPASCFKSSEIQPPPAEPIPSPEEQEKVQNMPEMIVIRVPDVVAVAAVPTGAADDAVVCSPEPRSSST